MTDALAVLDALDGEELAGPLREAAELLALVAGQDVEQGDDGVFRIARKVARDRVISTVDPEARHGHKSRNRRFDGYKAHMSVDPDSELIDDVVVTPANTHDADAVEDLLADHAEDEVKPTVMGDSAYARGRPSPTWNSKASTSKPSTPRARPRGRFAKDHFAVDLGHAIVTCPAGHAAAIVPAPTAAAGPFRHCARVPAAARLHHLPSGRTITIHPQEAVLQRASATQRNPAWQHRYRTDRPKVERKIAHFARRAWGGRKARTRGRPASPPTWTPAPGPSTGPGWPSSGSTTTRPAGRSAQRNQAGPAKTTRARPPRPQAPTGGSQAPRPASPHGTHARAAGHRCLCPDHSYFSTVLVVLC